MNKQIFFIILFCSTLPLLLLLLSYKTVVATHDFTPQQQEVMNYLNDEGNLPDIYNENESSHFKDVKVLMQHTNIVFYILLLIVTGLFTYNKKNKELIAKMLLYSGITTVSLLLFFTVSSFFFFDITFLLFHELFFPQGNYAFAIDSTIKTIFPNSLFFSITTRIGILSLAMGILFIGVSYLHKR